MKGKNRPITEQQAVWELGYSLSAINMEISEKYANPDLKLERDVCYVHNKECGFVPFRDMDN